MAKEARRRRKAPTVRAPEIIEIETSDGVRLRADVREPPWRIKRIGTVVLAHGLNGSRADFAEPDFAVNLAQLGFRTVAFDFRGHGDSGTGEKGSWRYDDLVARDLPSVVATARARNRPADGPVFVVGRALGGHAALASHATKQLHADAIVAISAAPWIRELEPSNVRWMVKRTAMRAMNEVVDRAGSLPLQTAYLGHVSRTAREGKWSSEDGAHDYLAALAHLSIPVLGMAYKSARLACPPECAAALIDRCGPKATLAIATDEANAIAVVSAWLASALSV